MRILFDITRLAWRARRVSPSGIDRVVLAYGQWLDAAPDLEVAPVSRVGGRLVEVSKRRFRRLLDQAGAAPVQAAEPQEAWDLLVRTLQMGAVGRTGVRRPAAASDPAGKARAWRELGDHWREGLGAGAPRGEVYLNVAHAGMHDPAFLKGLSERGLATAVMVHDLIPLTHPELCTPIARTKHALRIDAILAHASLVIANSEATAGALDDYARRQGARRPRVVAAPLGLEPVFLGPVDRPVEAGPYFVCVGVIEARKNLAFLLAVWRRLAETMGDDAPQLVLAGLRGWENEAVVDYLERCEPLQGLVHEVSGLSDAHLARLVAGARGLLAPSLAEGFDLPLMEALSIGTPAIASDIPVHRELAAGAVLIDPLDGPGWIAAIRAACGKRRKPVVSPGPSWDAHFAVAGRHLRALSGPAR